jgi:hypothetical protein
MLTNIGLVSKSPKTASPNDNNKKQTKVFESTFKIYVVIPSSGNFYLEILEMLNAWCLYLECKRDSSPTFVIEMFSKIL